MNCTIFDKAADFLPDECFRTPPDLAIILGSGWGEALMADRTLLNLSYADIPGFGAATVVGHAGEFKLYERAGKRIAAFCGRRHWYEGVGWETVVLPVELARRMGKPLLFTCYPAGLIQASQIADLAPLMPLGLYMRPAYLDK